MTVATASLLSDALDHLAGLAATGAEPDQARQRLDDLRERHHDVRLRLLWQREAFDGSIHYDLLVTQPGSGTVSLSYCPDRALPWPLRGKQPAGEKVLLRVNGAAMEVNEAIASLDFLWDEARLTDRLVTACLIREELEQAPPRLTDAELQNAMDAFRRARGLLSAAATHQWLTRRGLTHRDLEQLVAGEAAVARLRRERTADRVPAYFEQHRHGFDLVRIARVEFGDQAAADRFATAVRAGADFYAEAECAFTAGEVAASSWLFASVRRAELAPELAEAVAGAEPGSTIGPVVFGDGHAVIRVLGIESAVLDEATVDVIQRRLFADWLEERRRSARIDWYWGTTAGTAAAGHAQHHDGSARC
jgi:putative peptide maturation system protein